MEINWKKADRPDELVTRCREGVPSFFYGFGKIRNGKTWFFHQIRRGQHRML